MLTAAAYSEFRDFTDTGHPTDLEFCRGLSVDFIFVYQPHDSKACFVSAHKRFIDFLLFQKRKEVIALFVGPEKTAVKANRNIALLLVMLLML